VINPLSFFFPRPAEAVIRQAGLKRSPLWPATRDRFLKRNPACAVCGTTKRLEVHHRIPFHLCPNLELEPCNFITLCEPHHLLFGHLGNWSSYNAAVAEDAATWQRKIRERPGGTGRARLFPGPAD
jgi:5-methylcytosine-specific restriction protein A